MGEDLITLPDMLMPPMPHEYKDWEYREIRWLTQKYWDDFLALLGDGNYKILAMSTRIIKGETSLGGQFWISPSGMANIIKHNREEPSND